MQRDEATKASASDHVAELAHQVLIGQVVEFGLEGQGLVLDSHLDGLLYRVLNRRVLFIMSWLILYPVQYLVVYLVGGG